MPPRENLAFPSFASGFREPSKDAPAECKTEAEIYAESGAIAG